VKSRSFCSLLFFFSSSLLLFFSSSLLLFFSSSLLLFFFSSLFFFFLSSLFFSSLRGEKREELQELSVSSHLAFSSNLLLLLF